MFLNLHWDAWVLVKEAEVASMTVHGRWGQEAAAEVISRAINLGVNFFDTAPAYQDGASERILGAAVNKLTNRDKVLIATKFATRTPEEIKNKVSGKEHVLNSLNQSLKNLETDYVDLYIYHIWDWLTPHGRNC